MLILTRRVGETVVIGNDVDVTVLGVKGNQVRLGVKAPREVSVHREEIYKRIKEERAAGNGHDSQPTAMAMDMPMATGVPGNGRVNGATTAITATRDDHRSAVNDCTLCTLCGHVGRRHFLTRICCMVRPSRAGVCARGTTKRQRSPQGWLADQADRSRPEIGSRRSNNTFSEKWLSGRKRSPAKGVWVLKPIEGSNPSFSAINKKGPFTGPFLLLAQSLLSRHRGRSGFRPCFPRRFAGRPMVY